MSETNGSIGAVIILLLNAFEQSIILTGGDLNSTLFITIIKKYEYLVD